MSEAPVVLVIADSKSIVVQLVQNLKAHGLAAFGTTILDEAIRLMALLEPEVVVVDPTSDECFTLLGDLTSDWKSLGLVAIAESEVAADRARQMGIDEVIMSHDVGAIADAVLAFVRDKPQWTSSGEAVGLLVVDDEPEILDMMSDILGRRGYNVVEASSGDEALEIIDRDPAIHLVLLDIILPEKGGLEVLKELKRRHPHVIVILMSAIADSEIARHGRRLGAFDYILKPIDYEQLENRIIAGLADGEFHHQSWWKRFRPNG